MFHIPWEVIISPSSREDDFLSLRSLTDLRKRRLLLFDRTPSTLPPPFLGRGAWQHDIFLSLFSFSHLCWPLVSDGVLAWIPSDIGYSGLGQIIFYQNACRGHPQRRFWNGVDHRNQVRTRALWQCGRRTVNGERRRQCPGVQVETVCYGLYNNMWFYLPFRRLPGLGLYVYAFD